MVFFFVVVGLFLQYKKKLAQFSSASAAASSRLVVVRKPRIQRPMSRTPWGGDDREIKAGKQLQPLLIRGTGEGA